MKKNILFFLFVFISVFISGQENHNIIIDKEAIAKIDPILIKHGMQQNIKKEAVFIDIGQGPILSYLFQLPEQELDTIQEFQFISMVKQNKIYPSVFLLLDEKFDLLDLVEEDIELESIYLGGLGQVTKINRSPNIKYIIQTQIVSKDQNKIEYIDEFSNSIGVPAGNTYIIVPVGSTLVTRKFDVANTPKTQVHIPFKKSKHPMLRTTGIYLGMGVDFGGEKVALNTNGDDYRAGGGCAFVLGYSQILFNSRFSFRGGIGYKYQGNMENDASNQGGLFESIIVLQTQYINLGLGGHYDFSNRIKTEEGEQISFQNQFGPKFLLEYKWQMITFGVNYILMDFIHQNVHYNANRLGISIKFFTGSL